MKSKDGFAVLSIRQGCIRHHVSYDAILGIENEFVAECGADLVCIDSAICASNIAGRETGDGGIVDDEAVKELEDASYIFYATMSDNDLKIHLNTLKAVHDRLIIYLFDCWVPLWDEHERILRELDPLCVCFAYRKAAEHFDGLLDSVVIELPQSVDLSVFHPHDVDRTRLFIQIGRKNRMLHEQALKYLDKRGLSSRDRNYAYQRTGSDFWINAMHRPFHTAANFFKYRSAAMLAFPSMEEVSLEISRSMFSLCAPQCVDNYEKTGDISEVTPRYYESMACKSIPVGIKPIDTFDDLFPYEDAMIEVDSDDFEERISALINDPDRYEHIVETNYDYVLTHHRWKHRYEYMMNILTNGSEN